MAAKIQWALLAVVALGLGACNGVSTVRVMTNGPAEVSVDGQNLGAAPVSFPIPWRNIDNHINFSKRQVKVTANGQVVYDKDVSDEISAKALTGDFKEGSEHGQGRTYVLNVDITAKK